LQTRLLSLYLSCIASSDVWFQKVQNFLPVAANTVMLPGEQGPAGPGLGPKIQASMIDAVLLVFLQ
jgi:hypothetical protein